jgi:hypothetical protein
MFVDIEYKNGVVWRKLQVSGWRISAFMAKAG